MSDVQETPVVGTKARQSGPRAEDPQDKYDKNIAEHLAALGLFTGLCVDTNVFDGLRGAFEKGLLKQLEQFVDHEDVTLLMPEMIHGELSRHAIERAEGTMAALRKALKEGEAALGLARRTHETVINSLWGEKTAKQVAEERLSAFIEATGTELLAPSGYVDIGDLQELYLSVRPPFDKSGDKKSEFPDAFALLTLEGWAEQEEGMVLVVSHDKGWRDYCETSRRLHVVRDLAHAIGLFPKAETANAFLLRFDDWVAKSSDWSKVKSEISDSLWSLYPNVQAHSDFNYDEELTGFTLNDVYVSGDDATVVSATRNEWVIQVSVICDVTFDASFRFSVRDGIDGDDVPMGGCDEQTSQDVQYSLVLSFVPPQVGDDFPELSGVDWDAERTTVDFGEVRPDFS